MPADPLTPDVSARICLHMNNDHAEAVLSYARHYGGVEAPQSARMLQVLPEAMELEVDGSTVAVRLITPSPTARMPIAPWWPCCVPCPKAEQAQGLSRPRSCEPDCLFAYSPLFWSLRSAKRPQP